MNAARELSCGLDPAALMAALALRPDPWQADLLRSDARQLLLLCSRQAGKSTVAAILALHEAFYQPGSLVLMLAPSLRQSQELFRKLLTCYRILQGPGRADAQSSLRLELENGSRVVALPGREETIRGYSGVRLLVVDEAARVADELYYALRPMLAVSAGRLLSLSTPFGQRGWFYEEWTNGGDAWQRVQVPAGDCPRISSAFLDQERQALGARWFAQEYECRFEQSSFAVFSPDDIDRALNPDLEPLWGGDL
jgi:hypothetical protein